MQEFLRVYSKGSHSPVLSNYCIQRAADEEREVGKRERIIIQEDETILLQFADGIATLTENEKECWK